MDTNLPRVSTAKWKWSKVEKLSMFKCWWAEFLKNGERGPGRPGYGDWPHAEEVISAAVTEQRRDDKQRCWVFTGEEVIGWEWGLEMSEKVWKRSCRSVEARWSENVRLLDTDTGSAKADDHKCTAYTSFCGMFSSAWLLPQAWRK